MKKLAIALIAATFMALAVSLPSARSAEEAATVNPSGALKPDPFADVPPDHWAYNAVEYLRTNGLTEGYPDKTFRGKRPMTRYEFAQVIARMVQGLMQKIGERGAPGIITPPTGPTGVTADQLNAAINALRDELKGQMLTEDQVRTIVKSMLPDVTQYATKADLQTLQNLVTEFRNELSKLGVDVDNLKKALRDLEGRVAAIEAELRRRPILFGEANIIGKTSWKSPQIATGIGGGLRPALDHDARPIKETTNVLQAGTANGVAGSPATVLPYYDLDLGVAAQPSEHLRVGAVLNVGNYVSSYPGHDYTSAGADVVTPYKVFVNVPFRFLGSDQITVGRLGTQLTPYTFKAVDPDTYSYVPREDSGEVVLWGADTSWRFGGLKARAFAGVDPLDGRLLPLNVYPEFNGLVGGAPSFVNTNSFGGGVRPGSAPISTISNVTGARLTYGEPDVSPFRPEELPVGTATQLNLTPATPLGLREREVAPEAAPAAEGPTSPVAAEVTAPTGLEFGPFRNVVLGANWLMAAGRLPNAIEDSRAQVYGGDARFNLGPIRVEGEAAFGLSDTGGIVRPRALNDTALDVRGFWNFGLGNIADLQVGGGWRRVTLGYLVPGYWGIIGDWKNPRGIQGPLAEIRIPLKRDLAGFLRGLAIRASAEFYEGTNSVTPPAAAVTPDSHQLKIDRYLAGVQFGLTSRDTVDLGVEQVFRNYVPDAAAAAAGVPLTLPTMGIGGSPLVGTRIKNTETFINLGVGHSFTPDVAVKLLYQLVDFAKFAVDNSNQPASYRGYVATAQVGVRF